MIDPAKLTRGAQAVYGEEKFAEQYGEIVPIDESRIVTVADEVRDFPRRTRHAVSVYRRPRAPPLCIE